MWNSINVGFSFLWAVLLGKFQVARVQSLWLGKLERSWPVSQSLEHSQISHLHESFMVESWVHLRASVLEPEVLRYLSLNTHTVIGPSGEADAWRWGPRANSWGRRGRAEASVTAFLYRLKRTVCWNCLLMANTCTYQALFQEFQLY